MTKRYKVATDRAPEIIRKAAIIVLRAHIGRRSPHTRSSPDTGTRGTTSIGWEPVDSRIITARFTTKKKDIKLNIIQCYAPTNDAEDEKKVTV